MVTAVQSLTATMPPCVLAQVEMLTKLDEDRLALLIGAMTICLFALVAIVGFVSRAIVVHQRNKMEFEFKRELIDRGMEVDEVERIVHAERPRGRSLP